MLQRKQLKVKRNMI